MKRKHETSAKEFAFRWCRPFHVTPAEEDVFNWDRHDAHGHYLEMCRKGNMDEYNTPYARKYIEGVHLEAEARFRKEVKESELTFISNIHAMKARSTALDAFNKMLFTNDKEEKSHEK